MLSVARRTLVTRGAPLSRSISVSAARRAGGKVVVIQGEGAKAGTVPTDFNQATGLERFELLAKARGEDPFSMAPLEVTHMGTPKDPVKVFSLDTARIVGCTGYPADSHDTLWSNISKDKDWRCPECGCVYSIDYQGDAGADGHHH